MRRPWSRRPRYSIAKADSAERMIEERQKILDALQKADTRALSPESQAAVRRREAKLLVMLMKHREEAGKQL